MPAITLAQALAKLFLHPADTLLRKWNWKSAFLSSAIRALLFFSTNLTAGWRAAAGAMFAEAVLRAATSGFYGAMTQNFRAVTPAWQGAIAVTILLPLSSHSLEFAVHWMRHTPKLITSIVTSVCFTAVSTLFNWYAMRRGALVTGPGARSLAADMRAMPRMIALFVAAGPMLLWHKLTFPINEPQDAASD